MSTSFNNSKTDLLISVIVPVYNTEQYLRQCVDSIIAQTYSNTEIILIDDGSTDNSPAICEYYKNKDCRIKLIHKSNGGLSSARNAGLDIATGDVISFVDSDDWLEPQAYETMLRFMADNNLDVVFCCANKIYPDSVLPSQFLFYPDRSICSPEEITQKTLADEIGGQVWLKLYKKACWGDLRFPLGRLYEDIPISYRPFVQAKNPVGFLAASLYNYRINPSGISLTKQSQKAYHIFLGMLDHLEYSKTHFPNIEQKCLANVTVHALHALTDFYRSDSPCPELSTIEGFLYTNKKSIKKCKRLPFKTGLKATVFYLSRPLYRFLSRLIRFR